MNTRVATLSGSLNELGARPAWVDDELFPFESKFIEIDDSVVHYVDEGSGPILLLPHGNPGLVFRMA